MPAKDAHLTLPYRAQGIRLRAAMEHAELNQVSLSQRIHVAQATASRWLAGITSYEQRADDLAKVLQVTAAWLLTGEKAPRWASPLVNAAGETSGTDACRDCYTLDDLHGLARLFRERGKPSATAVAKARSVLLRLIEQYPTPAPSSLVIPDPDQHTAEVRRFTAAQQEDAALRAEILALLDA